MPFEITNEFILEIQQLIAEQKNDALLNLLKEVHYADIAEIVEELNSEEAIYLIKLLWVSIHPAIMLKYTNLTQSL